jgi:hypothetical protein
MWYDVKVINVCLGVFVAYNARCQFPSIFKSVEAASEHRSDPHLRAPPFRHHHMISMFYCSALARSDDEVPNYEEENPSMPTLRLSDVPQPQSCQCVYDQL